MSEPLVKRIQTYIHNGELNEFVLLYQKIRKILGGLSRQLVIDKTGHLIENSTCGLDESRTPIRTVGCTLICQISDNSQTFLFKSDSIFRTK